MPIDPYAPPATSPEQATARRLADLERQIARLAAVSTVGGGFLLEVIATADPSPPSTQWVACDGRALTTAAGFPQARGVLLDRGSPYGTSGSDPLIPDARGRAVVGVGSGASLTPRAPGDQWGTETQALTIAQLPPHAHIIRGNAGGALNDGRGVAMSTPAQSWGTAAPQDSAQPIQGAGDGAAHPNTQPSIALPCFIRLAI